MKRLISCFLQGLLYITPIAATVYVLFYIFRVANNIIGDLGILGSYDIPGVGLLILIILITLAGYFGQRIIKTPFAKIFEEAMRKAPLVRIIYTSVKDLMSAFVGKERKFESPVLVKIDADGIVERLGFITSNDLNTLGISDKISVYLPSSYGLLGELIIISTKQVTPIDANSAEVMKFIVSGGITKVKNKQSGKERQSPETDEDE